MVQLKNNNNIIKNYSTIKPNVNMKLPGFKSVGNFAAEISTENSVSVEICLTKIIVIDFDIL